MSRLKVVKLLIILSVGFFMFFQAFKKHNLTIYLTVGQTDGESLKRHVNLVIDDKTVFQDSLLNHIFVAEIFETQLNSGFHSLKVFNNGRNIVDQDFFLYFF